ncbi:MAG: DUF4870 domain-containing protein [Phycisphaera sp.]|nr:DUF4870 domain-containing protein [Phycisphaera sp.]
MAEPDPSSSQPPEGSDSAGRNKNTFVFALDISLGDRKKKTAPTDASGATLSPPRALLERWRLATSGRVVDTEAGDFEKVAAAAMHLWPLYTAVIGPLSLVVPVTLWLAFRRRSPLVRDHGIEVLSAQATMMILLLFICVGWVALIPWLPVWIVSLVRGAVAAGGGELFRYPAILRLAR